jgi:hypothetical protein
MQGWFHQDAPEVVWALLLLLEADGAEAVLLVGEPLPVTVVEVVELALVEADALLVVELMAPPAAEPELTAREVDELALAPDE